LNRPQVAVGLVLIVLSVLFFLSAAGLILVGIDALVSAGIVLLVLGFNVPERLGGSKPKSSAQTHLSELDVLVLQMVSQNKTQDDITRSTGVAPAILADKWSSLTSSGYISGNYLTEKGFDALRNTQPK